MFFFPSGKGVCVHRRGGEFVWPDPADTFCNASPLWRRPAAWHDERRAGLRLRSPMSDEHGKKGRAEFKLTSHRRGIDCGSRAM
jgi:hypothetical protein